MQDQFGRCIFLNHNCGNSTRKLYHCFSFWSRKLIGCQQFDNVDYLPPNTELRADSSWPEYPNFEKAFTKAIFPFFLLAIFLKSDYCSQSSTPYKVYVRAFHCKEKILEILPYLLIGLLRLSLYPMICT